METTTTQAPPNPMHVEPQPQHRWLQKLIGEWTYEVSAAEPGKPAIKSVGRETVRGLGDIWVLAEGQGDMGGAPATTLMTLGYDPQKKRFLGTWIGSMMTHMWIYDGELDAAQRVLTLNSEGPKMSGDGTTQYKDVIEFKNDDHRTLTAHVLDKGTWQKFMTADYRRRK